MAQHRDSFGNPSYGASENDLGDTTITTNTSTSTASSAVPTGATTAIVTCSTAAWIAYALLGATPTAAKSAGSLYLGAGFPLKLAVTAGNKFAALADAAAGTVSILFCS